MMSNPSAPVPRKRAACDRCRAQKLRCLRDEGHPVSACIRCVRSLVECQTSSYKRPGRPANRSSDTSHQSSAGKPPPPDTYRRSIPEAISSEEAEAMLEVMPADDWFNLDLFNADYETPKWPGVSVDTGEMYSDLAMIDGGSNSNTFTTSSPSVVVSEILNLTTSGEKICGRSRNHQQPDGETFGTELRLSVLYYDLGKLLFILRTMPWDMTKVMRLTWVHDTRVNSSEDYQLSLEDNPLAGILKRSADFIKFLKSYHLTKRSISDLLATLCCHMLILSIYDCIFQHFIDQYQQNPDPFDSIMQSAPQFQLGGIAIPPQANMLGHLLFTLMESRLRPIELLLGLPDEFCVALRRVPTDEDADDGLFSSQSSQSLFAALMHVEAERETGEVHGIGVIKSLREKVGHAQALK